MAKKYNTSVLKVKDADGNVIPIPAVMGDVLQTTGDSEEDTMSQKAITEKFREVDEEFSEKIADYIPKNQGTENVGKILVVGTDGNLTLIDMPEGGTNADVIGVFDDSNNILLSGNIAAGTYTLMFENEDGTYTGSGTLVVVETSEHEPMVNIISTALDPNLTDIYNGVGYKINTRYSFSSGGETTATNKTFTGLIPIGNSGDVFRIKDLTVVWDNEHNGQVLFYQQNGTLITSNFQLIGNYATISTDENGCEQFIFDGHTVAVPTNAYYFRVVMSPAVDNPIMTRNQLITV